MLCVPDAMRPSPCGAFSLSLVYRAGTLALASTLQLVAAQSRIDVPLMFDSDGRYVVPVSLSTGSSQQNLNFTVSTSTGVIYVAGAGNGGVVSYNDTTSKSVKVISNISSTLVFDQCSDATIVKETCALTKSDGSLLRYTNQTMLVINNPERNSLQSALRSQPGMDVSGLFGFGTNRVTTNTTTSGMPSAIFQPTFEDSFIGQHFEQYSQQENLTFAIALEKPITRVTLSNVSSQDISSDDSGLPAGMIHLVQPDPAIYAVNNVSWVSANVTASPSLVGNSSVPVGDWSVILDGWIFFNDDDALKSKGQITANIDPLYTGIYIPQDQATLIHAAIPGAMQTNMSTLASLSQAWTVPCTAQFSLGIIAGMQKFFLDESILVIDQGLGNNTCISGIEGWTDPSPTLYVLGARFISTIYVWVFDPTSEIDSTAHHLEIRDPSIFTVANNGTQTVGLAPRTINVDPPVPSPTDGATSSPSHKDVGPIIGGVLGGLALFILATFLCYWILSIPRKVDPICIQSPNCTETSSPERKSAGPGFIEPFTLMSPSSVQSYNDRYSSLPVREQRRSPSPVSIICVSPQAEHQAAHSEEDVAPPPSYRHLTPFRLKTTKAERIYPQAAGRISLASR